LNLAPSKFVGFPSSWPHPLLRDPPRRCFLPDVVPPAVQNAMIQIHSPPSVTFGTMSSPHFWRCRSDSKDRVFLFDDLSLVFVGDFRRTPLTTRSSEISNARPTSPIFCFPYIVLSISMFFMSFDHRGFGAAPVFVPLRVNPLPRLVIEETFLSIPPFFFSISNLWFFSPLLHFAFF